MKTIGIIAEFNPLHTGHKYLISEAKKQGRVVCVLSGNFVQRGDIAIAEKRVRAEAALRCGADLVVELPVCWSMSTAQNFALGGVSILKNIGCNALMFGSECGNINQLKNACKILNSDLFKENLNSLVNTGITFASAREKAAKLAGLDSDILKGANNNLAIEYINAAESINADFEFITLKRMGADHDSKQEDDFVSASLLREKLILNDYNFCRKYIPENIIDLFCKENVADIKNIEKGILSVLRTKTKEDLLNLPDLSEGLENKLFSAIRLENTLEKLYNNVKVKRYTHARIRRLVLSAFLGLDNSFFMKEPPYIRVLGFNGAGERLLKESIPVSSVPVILRSGEIATLPQSSQRIFEWECKAYDIYALALNNPLSCGGEYTAKLIKTECC